jgi:hypothetical protein
LKPAVVLLLLSTPGHADFCYQFTSNQHRFQDFTGTCQAGWSQITDTQAVDTLSLQSALTDLFFLFDQDMFAAIFFATITLYVIGMGIGWSIKYLKIRPI